MQESTATLIALETYHTTNDPDLAMRFWREYQDAPTFQGDHS